MVRKWQQWSRSLWAAYILWLRADCVDLSAAFAYHTLQSFFPALLIALAVMSRLLGRDQDLLNRLIQQVSQVLPPSNLSLFESTLQRFTQQGVGAGVLGVVLLIVSGNNIYLTLQRGADRLWWNRPFGFDGLPWQQLVRRFILLRLKAFVLLLLISILIVLDQLVSNLRFFGFKVLREWLLSWLPNSLHFLVTVSSGVDLLFSFVIGYSTALLFLWLLPSRRIPLRPLVWPALLVGFALTGLNVVLGRSLVSMGLRFQAYGVVGGVLVLTLWIWLVGLILYYGQCLGVVLLPRPMGGRSTLHTPL
jgi:membrane protein